MSLPNRTNHSIPLVLLIFVLSIFLSPVPVHGEPFVLPSFGEGKVNVRVYTDYFCGPCRSGEPKIEPILLDLVKRNVIRLTFVDTPVHKETPLYARYFLYILNAGKAFDHVLEARRTLFDAATIRILTKDRLEEFLGAKGISFKPFDAGPILRTMNNLINNDGVKSTPTVVIDYGSRKNIVVGVENIVKALETLK